MDKVKPYEVLPYIYPHLMKRIKYDKWANYLFALVKDDCGKKSNVLELAAGDCTFAKYFSKYFPSLIVTDLSSQMLMKNNDGLKKVCCNMLSFPFKTKFDLIYSNFDSVNYILSGRSLVKFLQEVSRYLNEGGIFTFDVSLVKNSYIHVARNNKVGKYKGHSYIQSSTFNEHTRIHLNKFVIKLANGTEYSEIHKEKIYAFETYFRLIEKTDLYVAECFESFTFNPGNEKSDRIQFILKKNKNAEL
jgi:SAM-dependent methyltransferase